MNRVPPFLRWLAASLIAIAALTGLFFIKGQGQPVPLPSYVTASATPVETQVPTNILRLLVLVTDSKDHVIGSALLIRSEGALHVINFDPHVVLDMGEAGLMDLYLAGSVQFPDQVQRGLELASGVPVDGTLVMQRLALAGLVDAIGGIDLVSPKRYNISDVGQEPDYIVRGMNHLTGSRAAAYAMFLVEGEPESDRINRLNSVLRSALSGLPNDPVRAEEVVSALGALARSTVPTSTVVDILTYFNINNMWPTATFDTMPTTSSELERTFGSKWRRIDVSAGQEMIASRVGPVDLSNLPLRVLVSGGLASQRLYVRDAWSKIGVAFVDGGSGNLRPITQVTIRQGLVPDDVTALLRQLKLRTTPGNVNTSPHLSCDVHIIIGTDLTYSK